MKSFKKNVFGFVHHAVLGLVIIGVVTIAGVKVLAGTHALTPSTSESLRVVKVYKESAAGKLFGTWGATKTNKVVNGNSTTVYRLVGNGVFSKTNLPQMVNWGGSTAVPKEYKGDRVRICAAVNYPGAGTSGNPDSYYGILDISLPTSFDRTDFVKRPVFKSNKFSYACTPYRLLKWDSYSSTNSFAQPAVYSEWQTAYVRDIKVEIAK